MTPEELIEQSYTPAVFDERYYNTHLTGGNPKGFAYDDKQQQEQLGFKWKEAQTLGFFPRSAFFVGCACGFEVKYWLRRGVDAFGMDVSEWAIAHADREVAKRVILQPPEADFFVWPGHGPAPDKCFDTVLAFDVLTLIPERPRATVISEMRRTANRGILVRTTVHHDPTDNRPVQGVDGVAFRLKPLEWWRDAFCQGGLFKMLSAVSYNQPNHVEMVLPFIRV